MRTTTELSLELRRKVSQFHHIELPQLKTNNDAHLNEVHCVNDRSLGRELGTVCASQHRQSVVKPIEVIV